MKAAWGKAGYVLLIIAVIAIAIAAVRFPSLSGLLGSLQKKREGRVVKEIKELDRQIEAGVGELDKAAEARAKAQLKLSGILARHTAQQVKAGAAPEEINDIFNKEGF